MNCALSLFYTAIPVRINITDRVVNNSNKVAINKLLELETVFRMSSADLDTRREATRSLTYGCSNDGNVIRLHPLRF